MEDLAANVRAVRMDANVSNGAHGYKVRVVDLDEVGHAAPTERQSCVSRIARVARNALVRQDARIRRDRLDQPFPPNARHSRDSLEARVSLKPRQMSMLATNVLSLSSQWRGALWIGRREPTQRLESVNSHRL